MTDDITQTTMHFVARLLYNLSPDPKDLDRRFEELDDREWNAWHMKAVAIINTAEPVWRERVKNNPGYDEDGYQWSVVTRDGQIFLQRSKGDALSLAHAAGLGLAREHRDRPGYEQLGVSALGSL